MTINQEILTETLTEHPNATGFTLQTTSRYSAFAMAEKMAFAGYSVQLSGIKGGIWTVVVTESVRAMRIIIAMQAFVLAAREARA